MTKEFPDPSDYKEAQVNAARAYLPEIAEHISQGVKKFNLVVKPTVAGITEKEIVSNLKPLLADRGWKLSADRDWNSSLGRYNNFYKIDLTAIEKTALEVTKEKWAKIPGSEVREFAGGILVSFPLRPARKLETKALSAPTVRDSNIAHFMGEDTPPANSPHSMYYELHGKEPPKWKIWVNKVIYFIRIRM